MQIFDVIPTTQEFLSYRKFPRLDDNSECDALRVPSVGRRNWPLDLKDMGGADPRCFPQKYVIGNGFRPAGPSFIATRSPLAPSM